MSRHNYTFVYSPDGKLLETRETLDADWFSRTASQLFPFHKKDADLRDFLLKRLYETDKRVILEEEGGLYSEVLTR